jgi:hypothetical protein
MTIMLAQMNGLLLQSERLFLLLQPLQLAQVQHQSGIFIAVKKGENI